MENTHDRLERAIAHQGLASRREAKALISSGAVSVNGKKITEPGFAINPAKDKITIQNQKPKETVLLYKPRGIETTKTAPRNKDIVESFPKLAHLSPVGRLDKESEGLILLTNDGTLTKALTQKESSVEKEYLVTVREVISDSALNKMASGIMLDKIKTLPTTTKRLSRHSFSIVLKEGRKHQIRRMCDAVHLTIESLVRIRIGHISVGKMKAGTVVQLSEKDVLGLKNK